MKSMKLTRYKVDEMKEITLHSLGLVCKRGIWYLIAKDTDIIKTYKASNIKFASITDALFNRSTDFNLEEYWKSSTSNFKTSIPKHTFTFKTNLSILNHIKARPFINIDNTVVNSTEVYIDMKLIRDHLK